MDNLRNFPLGKGVIDGSGKLYVNSYGRGTITKYCRHGYPTENPDVILGDDFSNRDYLNGYQPGNAFSSDGQGWRQSEWTYQFNPVPAYPTWESWDVSNGRFYLPHNRQVGFFFANPQEQFLLEASELPTQLDLEPDVYQLPVTPQYDPTGTEVSIDSSNRHFRLDLQIRWSPSTTRTLAITPYTTSLSTVTLAIASGTATFGGVLSMSTGNATYTSGVVLSFIWQSRGYEGSLAVDMYYNQLAILVNGNELTRSHCRVGTLFVVGSEYAHSPPLVVNFQRLLSDLTTWEDTLQDGALWQPYLLKINDTGTDPSPVYIDQVTLSRADVESDVFDDCCINGVGKPRVVIQNSDYPGTADGTYDQDGAGSPRFKNSSMWTLVTDSAFPKFIANIVIGGIGIPRPVYFYNMQVRMNEYGQPVVRITYAQSAAGASQWTIIYTVAGVYPNYVFPSTLTKAKSASGSWDTLNPLGANVEFVVSFY